MLTSVYRTPYRSPSERGRPPAAVQSPLEVLLVLFVGAVIILGIHLVFRLGA
jgi:hypothetical protein